MSAPTPPSAPTPEDEQPVAPLPEGHLACLACGVAVPPPHAHTEVLTAYGPREGEPLTQGALRAERRITFTRCASCQETYERAHDLMDTYPRVGQAIGSRSIAEHRVSLALLALDALARPAPSISEHHLRLLLGHLLPACGGLLWSSRYVPLWGRDAGTRQAAAQRWAHVHPETRSVLAEAYGALLRARIEAPRPVHHPEGGGCLLCGVGAVMALPSQSAWTPKTTSPSSIGGRGPERLSGYLCPACTGAVAEAGSTGPSAMEKALLRHLQVPRRSLAPVELVGLVGWGALGDEARPNSSPWEHLGPLERIADAARSMN